MGITASQIWPTWAPASDSPMMQPSLRMRSGDAVLLVVREGHAEPAHRARRRGRRRRRRRTRWSRARRRGRRPTGRRARGARPTRRRGTSPSAGSPTCRCRTRPSTRARHAGSWYERATGPRAASATNGANDGQRVEGGGLDHRELLQDRAARDLHPHVGTRGAPLGVARELVAVGRARLRLGRVGEDRRPGDRAAERAAGSRRPTRSSRPARRARCPARSRPVTRISASVSSCVATIDGTGRPPSPRWKPARSLEKPSAPPGSTRRRAAACGRSRRRWPHARRRRRP